VRRISQYQCHSVGLHSPVIILFIHISHFFCPLSFISRSKSSLWTPNCQAYQDLFNFDGGGNRSARTKPPVRDPRRLQQVPFFSLYHCGKFDLKICMCSLFISVHSLWPWKNNHNLAFDLAVHTDTHTDTIRSTLNTRNRRWHPCTRSLIRYVHMYIKLSNWSLFVHCLWCGVWYDSCVCDSSFRIFMNFPRQSTLISLF
jgi:hypothetical protein